MTSIINKAKGNGGGGDRFDHIRRRDGSRNLKSDLLKRRSSLCTKAKNSPDGIEPSSGNEPRIEIFNQTDVPKLYGSDALQKRSRSDPRRPGTPTGQSPSMTRGRRRRAKTKRKRRLEGRSRWLLNPPSPTGKNELSIN